MKTSNKILLGLFAAIALNVLTGMVMLRNSLSPGGIGYGETIITGEGPLKKIRSKVANFKELEIEGNFKITLSQGEEFVEIEAEENIADLFEVKVDDQTLYFDAKEGYTLLPTQGIEIKIGFKELKEINAYGLSNISSNQTLTFNQLELGIHGSGTVKFPLTAQKLAVQFTGASRGYLSGTADKLEVSIAGAGGFEAEQMDVKEAEVRISGAGYANLQVTDYLNASTVGSGTVRYLGDPKVDKRTAGAGKIYKK